MQLHFGRGGRLTHLPPRLTQFLIATVGKLEVPVSYCKQTIKPFSNRNKIGVSLELAHSTSLNLSPIFRAAILLLTLAVFGPQAFAQTRTEAQHSPAIYPTMVKVQSWIPMKDGVRLAVNLYMPEGAKPDDKFPAILEYLPYRKDDWTLERDWNLHSYFVRRGYITARVDIRGTGASEGAPPDREYSYQEQQNGLEVIAWLARQPWSNGNVGMMGISWGGFNAIQLARLHPPALKAIIAVCATEARRQNGPSRCWRR